MNATERFPKPDVPWFHEIYGGWGDDPPQPLPGGGLSFMHPSKEWETSVRPAVQGDPPICGEPRNKGFCGLAAGHDGPHFGWRNGSRAVVVVLRRVAQPARVSS